jgi:Sulfotransferase family
MEIVIISGAARSGTTYLAAMLNTHPAIGILHERPLSSVIDALGCLYPRYSKNEIVDALQGDTGIFDHQRDLPFPQSVLQDNPGRVELERQLPAEGYAVEAYFKNRSNDTVKKNVQTPSLAQTGSILRRLFEGIYEKAGIDVIGTKIPDFHKNPEYRALQSLGLRYKEIFLFRNPLDVVNSSLHRRNLSKLGLDDWGVRNIDEAIANWVDNWRHAFLRSRESSATFHVAGYDELMSNFDNEIRLIAAFLNVDVAAFVDIARPLPTDLRRYALTEKEVERFCYLFDCDVENQSMIAFQFRDYRSLYLTAPSDGVIIPNADPGLYLRSGFGEPEVQGRWMLGQWSEIRFRINGARAESVLRLDLSFDLYWRRDPCFVVYFEICGRWQEPVVVHPFDPVSYSASFTERVARGEVLLRIYVPRPKTTSDDPVGEERSLGIFLKRLSFSISDEAAAGELDPH